MKEPSELENVFDELAYIFQMLATKNLGALVNNRFNLIAKPLEEEEKLVMSVDQI